MADFGSDGKITVRNNRRKNAVIVKVNDGEYLHFRLKVQGAVPNFVFSGEDSDFIASTTEHFPNHPQQIYEWKWGKNSSDVHSEDEMHALRMNFVAAIKYTLFVEHRSADDNIIEILKDIDFESQNNQDRFREGLRILVPQN